MIKDQSQPIIVVKKKVHGHGHHGGAWKVAYADFVTAMMAFFLLLWLLGSTTPEEQRYISGYFKDPGGFGIGEGGVAPGVIPMENAVTKPIPSGHIDHEFSFRPGEPDTDKSMSSDELRPESSPKSSGQEAAALDAEAARKALATIELQTLTELKDRMEKAIASEAIFKEVKDQLLIDVVDSGLRIQIVDKENRPSFDLGRARPKPYTEETLHALAELIQSVPNRISITGHTDGTPYPDTDDGYTNWELSTDRANSARRHLLDGGLDPAKIATVQGFADTALLDPKNPEDASNRRIAIIVLKKEADEQLRVDSSAQGMKMLEDSAEQKKAIPSLKDALLDDDEWDKGVE